MRNVLALRALTTIAVVSIVLLDAPVAAVAKSATPAAARRTSATPQATPATGPPSPAQFVWQADGGPNVPLGAPGFVAIDPQGQVWVADNDRGQFVIFAPDGTVVETWGTSGSGQGQFNFACSADFTFGAVAFDATGTIYVADAGNHRIQKFAPDRSFLTSWGRAGFADDQFQCPAAVAVDGQGHVYVSDQGWGKIKVFASDGTWLATWTGATSPFGLATDAAGNVWVADYGAGHVIQFSPAGHPLATWGDVATGGPRLSGPIGVAVDTEGRVFVTEFDAGRVQVLAPDGTVLGTWGSPGSGQFVAPVGIALDGRGAVYVSDSQHGLQKFQLLLPAAEATPVA
jgi:sugar lactone lactonase YvrE